MRRLLTGWLAGMVVGAAFAVLVVAGVSRDLFLVGVADSAVVSLLADEPAEAVGITVSAVHRLDEAAITATDTAFAAETAQVSGLGELSALRFTGGEGVTVANGTEFVRARSRIVTAPGLVDSLGVIDRIAGPGLHLTEDIATSIGAVPGDVLTIQGLGPDREATVVGIVVEPDRSSAAHTAALPSAFFATYVGGGERFGPALLIVEPGAVDETFPCVFDDADIAANDGLRPACPPIDTAVGWRAALESTPTSADALDGVLADYRRIERDLADPTTALGRALTEAGSTGAPPLDSRLVDVAREADAAVNAARPAVGALRFAGLAMGVGTVALAAVFVAARRRDAFFLAGVDGVHPIAVGLRSAVRLLPAVLVGLAVGMLAAPIVVRWAGPSIDATARDLGVMNMVIVAVVGIATLAIATVAVAISAAPTGGPDVSRVHSVPWDLLVYGLAAAIFVQSVLRGDDDRGRVDALVVLLPIVGIAALVLLQLRVLRLLGRLRRSRSGAPVHRPVLTLGIRRVTSAAPETVASIVLLGVAAGVSVFASSLVETSERAVDDKAVSAVGGRTTAEVRGADPSWVLPERTTIVGFRRATLVPDRRVRVMVIDPDTWADAVDWNDRIGISPDEVIRLVGDQTGVALPAVAVGTELPSGTVSWGSTTVPVDVVADVPTLPLVDGSEATLVIRSDLLDARFRAVFEQQLVDELGPIDDFAPYEDRWVPPSRVLTRHLITQMPAGDLEVLADGAGIQLVDIATRSDFSQQEDVMAQRWAFDYFELLTVLGLLTVVAVVAVWVSVRHRGRVVALALLRRMGMGRLRQAMVMVVEMTLMLGVGLLLGLISAVLLLRASAQRFEPLPEIGPVADAVLSRSGVATVVVIVVAGVVMMVSFTQAASARTPTGKVLREQ